MKYFKLLLTLIISVNSAFAPPKKDLPKGADQNGVETVTSLPPGRPGLISDHVERQVRNSSTKKSVGCQTGPSLKLFEISGVAFLPSVEAATLGLLPPPSLTSESDKRCSSSSSSLPCAAGPSVLRVVAQVTANIIAVAEKALTYSATVAEKHFSPPSNRCPVAACDCFDICVKCNDIYHATCQKVWEKIKRQTSSVEPSVATFEQILSFYREVVAEKAEDYEQLNKDKKMPLGSKIFNDWGDFLNKSLKKIEKMEQYLKLKKTIPQLTTEIIVFANGSNEGRESLKRANSIKENINQFIVENDMNCFPQVEKFRELLIVFDELSKPDADKAELKIVIGKFVSEINESMDVAIVGLCRAEIAEMEEANAISDWVVIEEEGE